MCRVNGRSDIRMRVRTLSRSGCSRPSEGPPFWRAALTGALLLAGTKNWPRERFMAVAVVTVAFGVAYTGFSEWLNVYVRKSWAYSGLMPVLPIAGGIGISPLLQWVVVPTLALWCARRLAVTST